MAVIYLMTRLMFFGVFQPYLALASWSAFLPHHYPRCPYNSIVIETKTGVVTIYRLPLCMQMND
jgi:hypothetical protein